MNKRQISLSVSNLMSQLFCGIRSIRQRGDHANRLASEKDDGKVNAVGRVDEYARFFLQAELVAQTDTELKSSGAEVREHDGPACEGVDERWIIGEARLGGEVVSENGIGRSKLHGRVW